MLQKIMTYTHHVLTLYELGESWTDGISLVFIRKDPIKFRALKVPTP